MCARACCQKESMRPRTKMARAVTKISDPIRGCPLVFVLNFNTHSHSHSHIKIHPSHLIPALDHLQQQQHETRLEYVIEGRARKTSLNYTPQYRNESAIGKCSNKQPAGSHFASRALSLAGAGALYLSRSAAITCPTPI